MASRSTIERALHKLSRDMTLIVNMRSDADLRAEVVYDLTHFERDVPVKDGMYCGADVTPDYVYRDGYRFQA